MPPLPDAEHRDASAAPSRGAGADRAAQVAEAMRALRETVQELQVEMGKLREEKRRLASRLRDAEAVVVAAESAQSRIEELEERVRVLSAAPPAPEPAPEPEPAQPTAGTDADERIAELEAALETARRERLELVGRLRAAQKERAEDAAGERPPRSGHGRVGPLAATPHAEASGGGDGFPTVPGVRIERAMGAGPGGFRYQGRETSTRRAVDVYLLPAVLDLLDGKRLDSVLLAKHPALVSALSFAVCEQGPYLVTERSEGEALAEWAARVGRVPERLALSLVLEVARGMRHAAAQGASHGDLSPQSIVVELTGAVRVRGVGLRAVFSRPHEAPAAPEYAAPERLRGDVQADVPSDLYSLGAVLFSLLTGGPPYVGSPESILRLQASGRPPRLRDVRADVSERTAQLVARLLAGDPSQRFQRWDPLLVELERLAARSDEETAARSGRAFPAVFFVGAAALLVTALVWWWQVGHDETASETFAAACADAERMEQAGDRAGARSVYRAFLSGTGDAAVEAEAARRFDLLR